MNEEHPEELLAAYALGCLDEDELAGVERHLARCPQCTDQVRSHAETCTRLAYLAPPATPPATLKVALLANTAPPTHSARRWLLPTSWRNTLIPGTALACLVLALLFGLYALPRLQGRGADQAVSLEQLRLVYLVGTAQSPRARGTLVINAGQTQALLQVAGLASLPAESQYQLWLIDDGVRSNGGVFSVDRNGAARLLVRAERPLESFEAFGITIEPYGGSPGPTGPKVLGGKSAG